MGGINTGPGEGKGPKDRNEFPLGPFHIEVDWEMPQVRQKAETNVSETTVAQAKVANTIVNGVTTAYNPVNRIGEATVVSTSETVVFYNSTRLPPIAPDEILLTKLADERWMMVGLVSDVALINLPTTVTGPAFDFDFPIMVDDLIYPFGFLPAYDMNDLTTLGEDSIFGPAGFGVGSSVINGISREKLTQFTFGAVPSVDWQSTAAGGPPRMQHMDGYIVVNGVNSLTAYVYDPVAETWTGYPTTVNPTNNINALFGDRVANSFMWCNNVTSGTSTFETFSGGGIVSLGTLGLPSGTKINRFPYRTSVQTATSLFQEQGNGFEMVSIGTAHYVRPAGPFSGNFVQIPYVGSIPAGIDVVDIFGQYLYTVSGGNLYETSLLTASQTVIATNIIPATFTPRTAQMVNNNTAILIAGEENGAYLPTPSGKVGDSLAMYLYDISTGVTTLFYYDHDFASAGGTTYLRMSAIDAVLGGSFTFRLFISSYAGPAKLLQFNTI